MFNEIKTTAFPTDEKIMKRLRKHLDLVLESYPEDRVIAIALQGSQNYGLATETSDVDSKVIVAPSFDQLLDLEKETNRVIPLDSRFPKEDQVTILDARHFLSLVGKSNPTMLELLFTPFLLVNDKYKDAVGDLFADTFDREIIANASTFRTMAACAGIMHSEYKRLPAEKAMKHFFRFYQLFETLRHENKLYSFMLNPESIEMIKHNLSPENRTVSIALIHKLMDEVDKELDEYKATHEVTAVPYAQFRLKEFLRDICRISLEKEFH